MSDKIILSKIGKRFTVVIPPEIHKTISLKEGESIILETDGKKITITPKDHNWAEQLEKLMGDVRFNRTARQEALQQALELVHQQES